MMLSDKLPEFFVVGAQKAGTTSLHNWLVQQPDICLPELKETHFFTYDDRYERGIDWYLGQFKHCVDGTIRGEICPDYMFFREAPQRIRQYCEEPKIIFIFRHPIDRAFSQYRMTRLGGYENLPFYDALMQENVRLTEGGEFARIHYSYMTRGRYASQVNCFLKELPKAKCLYVKFDDLIDTGVTGEKTYMSICDFIGIRSPYVSIDRSKKINVASEARGKWLRDMLYHNLFRQAAKKLIPNQQVREKIVSRLYRWNQRPLNHNEAYEIPEEIYSQARVEISNLQALTHLDLNDWLKKDYKFR